MSEPVASPCNRHCCLNDKDVCMGCYRTLDEILKWTQFSNEQKRQVIKQCEARKKCKN